MLKIIGKYVGTGFLYGLGFAIAVVLIVFISEKAKWDREEDSGSHEERQANYIKSIVESIESNGTDQCGDIVGTWVGEFVEEDGSRIKSWELNYEEDGRFWGTLKSKSITEESEERQEGKWECHHSVLFTDVNIEGDNRKWTYLLLHNENGERVYATLGSYRVKNVYRAYRKK